MIVVEHGHQRWRERIVPGAYAWTHSAERSAFLTAMGLRPPWPPRGVPR